MHALHSMCPSFLLAWLPSSCHGIKALLGAPASKHLLVSPTSGGLIPDRFSLRIVSGHDAAPAMLDMLLVGKRKQ